MTSKTYQSSITTFIPKRCRSENECSTQELSSSISIDNLDLDSEVNETDNPTLTNRDSSIEPDIIFEGASTEGCSSKCCDENLCEPYHPNNDILITKRRQGKQYRVLQMTWFDDHDWLSFCITRNKVFCFFCRKASSRGLLMKLKSLNNPSVAVNSTCECPEILKRNADERVVIDKILSSTRISL